MQSKSTRILILCTEVTPELYQAYRNRCQVDSGLSGLSGLPGTYKLILIADKEPNNIVKTMAKASPLKVIYYNNKQTITSGFWGATSFLKCCAWDKALRYLIEKERRAPKQSKYRYTWLLEDDVYLGQQTSFSELIDDHADVESDFIHPAWTKTFENSPNWSHWRRTDPLPKSWKKSHSSSLNVICRLNDTMIHKIGKLQARLERLVYHEILFVTVARHHGLSISRIVRKYQGHITAGHMKNGTVFDTESIRTIENTGKYVAICHPYKRWWLSGS